MVEALHLKLQDRYVRCMSFSNHQSPEASSCVWISVVLPQSEAVNHSNLSHTEASGTPESSATRNLPMIHAGLHPFLHQHRPRLCSWGAISALRGLQWRLVL